MRKLYFASLLAASPLFAQTASSDPAELVAGHSVSPIELALPAGTPAEFTARLVVSGRELVVDFEHSSPRARGFRVLAQAPNGDLVPVVPPPSRIYRGTVRGRAELRVSASLSDAGLTAAILGDDGSAWFLQPARDFTAGAAYRRHAVYRADGMPLAACGSPAGEPHAGRPGRAGSPEATAGSIRVAEIAFDLDYEYYLSQGSSVANCVRAVEQTLDAVDLIYERDVEITYVITTILVRQSEPDPYSGKVGGDILTQFRTHWNTQQQGIHRDVAHLITARAMGNILGLAYLSGICNQNGYALSRFGATFGQNVTVLGHELGHNWSAPHCLDASCVLMCGGCHQFGPLTIARIKAYRDGLPCLGTLYPELRAHYRLDETGGFSAKDASGGGHDGVYTGGIVLGGAGAAPGTGTAVVFDGVDDAVIVQDGPGLRELNRMLTVAAWVRPQKLRGWQRFVSHEGSWSFGLFNDRLAFTTEGVQDYVATATLLANTWHHVAAVFDNVGDVTFYVDGQNAGTVAGTDPAPMSMGSWYLGSRSYLSETFAGALDDVQIYRGMLSDGHVALLFASPGRLFCAPRWSTYGAGLAGKLGVPALAIDGDPVVGATFRVLSDNSSGFPVIGALVLGGRPASLPLLGGTLLVDTTTALVLPMVIAVPGGSYALRVPSDPNLNCAAFHLQVLQRDPAAVQGVSFTAGVQLQIGG